MLVLAHEFEFRNCVLVFNKIYLFFHMKTLTPWMKLFISKIFSREFEFRNSEERKWQKGEKKYIKMVGVKRMHFW